MGVITRLKTRLTGGGDGGNGRLIRNLAWMGMSQGVHRIARLGATLVAARMIAPESFGIAAIVLTAHEIMHAISNAAVVPALVQAGREGYERLCRDAYWFNWVVCLGLMVLQMALAPLLAYLYDAPDLALPLMALALIFPMLPPAAINAARILRSNRLHITARIEMGQSIGEAVGVMLLAAMGAGFWALILPKLIVTPIWTLTYRWCESWRIDERPSTLWSRPLMSFARPMMGVEVVSVLRQQMDYLLVGALFAMDVLGVYFFAFNAGLGISLGLLRAYSTAIFPQLCGDMTSRERLARMHHGMRLFAMVAVPAIIAQSLLAPWYVPILFGEAWVERGALPILILICLSALPRILLDSCGQLLRAQGMPGADLKLQIFMTLMLGAGMFAGVPFGINGVAAGILVGISLAALPGYLWTRRLILAQDGLMTHTSTQPPDTPDSPDTPHAASTASLSPDRDVQEARP